MSILGFAARPTGRKGESEHPRRPFDISEQTISEGLYE